MGNKQAFRASISKRLLHLSGDGCVKVVVGMPGAGKTTFKTVLARQLPGSAGLFDFDEAGGCKVSLPPYAVATVAILDEPQVLPDYSDVVDNMLETGVEVYVFASDARATGIKGAESVEFFPLSFAEYMEASGFDYRDALERYMAGSTLPHIALSQASPPEKREMAFEAYREILSTAVNAYPQNTYKFTDSIARYLMRYNGDHNTPLWISWMLFLVNNRATPDACRDAISALKNVYFIKEIECTDTEGFPVNKVPKYYVADPGMAAYLYERQDDLKSRVLENVVLMELLRRRYRVTVCVIGEREVDFRAVRGTERLLIQVIMDATDPRVLEHEAEPIRDYDGALILYLDGDPQVDGVDCVNVVDWLLSERRSRALHRPRILFAALATSALFSSGHATTTDHPKVSLD